MPPKFDAEAISIIYIRVVGGEVPGGATLAPKCGPLGLAPKKVGEEIVKATQDWKGQKVTVKLTVQNRKAVPEIVPSASALVIKALNEPVRDRKKTKNILHDGNIPLEKIYEIARDMRFKSMAREFKGTVKEILGTCNSVGCKVEGESPKVLQERIDSGSLIVPAK
eukprot:NODE_1971_length_685_cov_13.338710_g1921_i0.p1 GENE.NODE_1971_length_685_cov_13.338710_g1921_i0~~NODE_1971_length_685_cov_13.338710_g1921_i0.p1  ORF type:complete len:166 (-),score=20.97 NODE_1971_length_685_cov_13.338710_g1921_i0:137-634(-)